MHSEQLFLFPEVEQQKKKAIVDKTSTFADNTKLPIHRWFRYSAGFSAEWVKSVIRDTGFNNSITLFDPFVGSGTTVLAGEECGIESLGIEAHPFVVRIAKTKLLWYKDADEFKRFAMEVLQYAQELADAPMAYPKLIHKCYPEERLNELDKLRRSWLSKKNNSGASELTWLALVSILRIASSAGTAPWQYVLPRKVKKEPINPYTAFFKQVEMMEQDMLYFQIAAKKQRAVILTDDARECTKIKDNSVDLIITSPPYANNYDYADATRLEMSFLGEIQNWGELQGKVRNHLIRSCSQHVSAEKNELKLILADDNLYPIIDELQVVCHKLEEERHLHGGRKNYHLMVAAYFSDLARTWASLRRICKSGANVCFVIGNSAPYGVLVPADQWLGKLALSVGFKSYHFEKTRDRNVKWKIARKHKIPLHEGRLWVEA